MSIRLTRYRSTENGTFSRLGRNLAHIKIPASAGFADLEHSTLVFRMRMNTNLVRPASLEGAAHMLIRRCKESTDRLGTVSEKIFQNNVNGNLDNYMYSRQEGESARNLGMRAGYYNAHGDQYTGTWTNAIDDAIPEYSPRGYVTPFFQPSAPRFLGDTTTAASVMNRPEIHVPFKYISDLANSDNARNQMPLMAIGSLHYEIELDNRLRCTQWEDTYEWPCNNVTADGSGNVAAVVLTETFEDNVALRKLDLAVGTLVKVTWTGGSGGASEQNTEITQLAVSAAGVVTVTAALTGLTAGQTLTGVTIDYRDPPANSPEYAIDDMWVELHRLQLTPQQLDGAVRAMNNLEINFRDYYLKPEQLTAAPIYEQTMQVPRGSRGVAVLTPQNVTAANQFNRLYSGWDNAERYRFQVTDSNGVLRDTTNRDVEVYVAAGRFNGTSDLVDVWNNRALHNVRLKEFFANIGVDLKRYDRYGSTAAGALARQDIRGFYPQMLVPSAEQQAMNFILSTNGTNNMTQKTVLFVFFRDRKIVLSNGQARLM